MKKIAIVAIVVAAIAALCAPVCAQTYGNNKDECLSALADPGVKFYRPQDLHGTGRMPVNGTSQVLMSFPHPVCAHMATGQGVVQWVAQEPMVAFRAQPNKDGLMVIYSRNDCGNAVDEIAYPIPTPATTVVASTPPPQPIVINNTFSPEFSLDLGKKFKEPTDNHSDSKCKNWCVVGIVAGVTILGVVIAKALDKGDDKGTRGDGDTLGHAQSMSVQFRQPTPMLVGMQFRFR